MNQNGVANMLYEDEFYDEDVERQAAFRRKEIKVYEYAMEFWKEVVPYCDSCKRYISDDILPLYCFDKAGEIFASMEQKKRTYIAGGMVNFKEKQAVIRIGIDGFGDTLDDKLKKTIRHEIIHYLLWSTNHAWQDDSLEFWCLCHVCDGGAYEKLSDENKVKFSMFRKAYNYYLKNEWHSIKTIVVPQILNMIKNEDIEYKELAAYTKRTVKEFRDMFGA